MIVFLNFIKHLPGLYYFYLKLKINSRNCLKNDPGTNSLWIYL